MCENWFVILRKHIWRLRSIYNMRCDIKIVHLHTYVVPTLTKPLLAYILSSIFFAIISSKTWVVYVILTHRRIYDR